MIRRSFNTMVFAAVLVVLFGCSSALAYQRYNDGCQSCHGAFTDNTSTKGSTFPSGGKHDMHRSSSYMNTNCNLCHRADDGRDPYTASSTGTATNAGVGCTGCHNAAGLRLHHASSGVGVCADCHSGDPAPPKENIRPPYYGTIDTKAANPCNATAQNLINENWTTNCCEGLDTDGDNLYDMNDPDCFAITPTPGEAGAGASPLRVTAYNRVTKALTISFGTACSATNNNIEYGLLANVRTYGYSGQVCSIGNTGTATFTPPTGNIFFLVVARDATKEGSYGKKRIGNVLSERPEDTTSPTCPVPQSLTARCD